MGRKAAIKSIIAQATDAEKQEITGNPDLIDRLSQALGRSDMLSLMSELSAPLKQRLAIAVSGWRADLPVILNLTANAPLVERQEVLDDVDLIARLDSKLRHHDMLTVLNNLKGSLVDKLNLMVKWGGYAQAVVSLIQTANEAEKEEIANHTAILSEIMSTFREDYKEQAIHHLNLLAVEMFTNNPNNESVGFTSLMVLSQDRLTISKEVNFLPRGTFGYDKEGFETLKSRFIASVTNYLSNKFTVKIESADEEQEGKADGEYKIIVKLSHNPSANYLLILHGGAHGVGHVKQLRGNIYELGLLHETLVPDVFLAHEGAHLLLGADDEYGDPEAFRRTIYTDNSLMGNFYREGIEAAEIKERHFAFLVPLLKRWFPDYTIRICST